jgi:hypothetical protein
MENRSFAPAGVPAVAKTEPVSETRPNMRELARGVNNLHNCLEEARADIGKIEGTVSDLVSGLAHVRGTLDAMAKGFGLPTGPQAEADAKLKPKTVAKADWRLVLAFIGSLSGVLVLFQLLNAVVPAAWQALLSVQP